MPEPPAARNAGTRAALRGRLWIGPCVRNGGNRLNQPLIRPPRRTPFIGLLDGAIRVGRAIGAIDSGPLEKGRLLADAADYAGLDDFGDRWFERPMEVLLDAVRDEARLNAAGEFSARQQFHKVLVDRLWARRWFARHPEILARPVHRPVVIVGPMRSGTTRLHRLLASDRRFSHLRSFETISPVPRPGFEAVMEGRARDFRPILASRIMKVARLANPRTLSIHPTGPHEPEEELGLLVSSMWGMKHEAQWSVPSYGRWCEGEDAAPAYAWLKDLLRLVGWSQQVSSIRPWILKTPQHMLDLPALLKVFPDARLIFTHRDPRRVVASSASLAWNQTIIYSDHADPGRIGAEWLRKSALAVDRMMAARRMIAPERMIDVQYEDMDSDWRCTMARVYRFVGFDMEPAVAGMERYLQRSRRLKRHPHRYSLDEFGIAEGEVLERFAGYIQRFGVPIESPAQVRRQLRR
jgi:hypothetical protein